MTEARFAFDGRVSTEDQQDPASSKQWQRSRAQSIIDPVGGVIVTEFFDIGQSRSLPWKRRPESASLLDAFKSSDRGFDAVVIREPARAFYGNQFGLTFPVFVHYGIELWVPEVGGRVDPGSDAHDLVMSLYGGMSKGERNRIKVRVRSAMAAQAQHEGRYLGGRPPYGYMLADAGPHPNPGKAAVGQRIHRLDPDLSAAPIVGRIFSEYLNGRGLFAFAEGLTRDRVPSPSAHDPARNRDRDTRGLVEIRGSGNPAQSALRRPSGVEPAAAGRGPARRRDVAAGHETKLRWNDRSLWIWSTEQKHEPLVTSEDFAAVQERMAAGLHRPTPMKGRAKGRRYSLSGLVHCAICGRRMQGTFAHDTARYRCRFPSEYALANTIEHPLTVYVKEDAIVPRLDEWIAELFDEANLDATCEALGRRRRRRRQRGRGPGGGRPAQDRRLRPAARQVSPNARCGG
jgi:site-specific DNA recombinase